LLSHYPIGNVNRKELLRNFVKKIDVKILANISSGYPSDAELDKHVVTALGLKMRSLRKPAKLIIGPVMGLIARTVKPDVYWLIDDFGPHFAFHLIIGVPIVYHLDDPVFTKPPPPILYHDSVKKIVVPSQLIKDKLCKFWGVDKSLVEIIPFGVDLKKFIPTILPDSKTVLYYGSLDYSYRGKLLLEVINEVTKMIDNVKFIIIGMFTKEFLEKLIELQLHKFVSLHDYVSHDKLPEYARQARVCILPQMYSAGGRFLIKLIEYMALGRPIVATDVEESWLIRESGAGVITPIDKHAMAEAIVRLLEDDALAKEYAKAGIRYAQKHDWSIISEKYLKVLEEACRRRSAP